MTTESNKAENEKTGSGHLKRGVMWLARKMKWCFKKRLAIYPSDPIPPGVLVKMVKMPDVYLYEWQEMPKGYRWW